MARLLIRAGKSPLTVVAPETTLTQDVFNSNSGNFLFQHTVWKSLAIDGSELIANSTLSERHRGSDADAAAVNAEFDHFVVPMANSFRADFIDKLDNLSDFIDKLTIPVTVVGIGAQAGPERRLADLAPINESVRTFVGRVLDRSASIGVRGEFTKEYLMSLGFRDDDVDIIGCPSLFLHGPEFSVRKKVAAIDASSPVSINLTPEVPGIGAFSLEQLDRQSDLTYIGQDQHDLRLLLWGVRHPHVTDPEVPAHLHHPMYQNDVMRLFVDTWTWYEHLAARDFVYGTRFHGNVAALLAGTPAMLLAHDSRTLELAEYHHMPHRVTPSFDGPIGAAELYDATELADFNLNLPHLFDRYVNFLGRNGLAHRWQSGHSGAEFDAAVAETEFPAAVRPLTANSGGELASRIEWLRQAAVIDMTRHPERYEYPFGHPEYRGAGSRHARLMTEQSDKLAAQQKQLTELTTRIDRIERGAMSSLWRWCRRQGGRVARRFGWHT